MLAVISRACCSDNGSSPRPPPSEANWRSFSRPAVVYSIRCSMVPLPSLFTFNAVVIWKHAPDPAAAATRHRIRRDGIVTRCHRSRGPALESRMLQRCSAILLVSAATVLSVSARPSFDPSSEIAALIRTSGADVAVAYRMLDGGDELFVQPDVEYHAASTMKVPVLIELFRQARAGTISLDDQIPVVNQFHSIVDGSPFALDVSDDSDAAVYKRSGGRMSYRELAEAMITVSSNFATNLIIEHLAAANIQKTTVALGAPGMRVLRGVEDDKAFQRGLNNVTTARSLLTLL